MNVVIFDTETTSIDKPFCYNVGFVIYDTEEKKIIFKKEFVVEQVWHNLPLFNSAYYADKRPIYVNRMRAKKIILEKWGYICQKMARIFKEYEVVAVYAYNSPFDKRVFEFNCDWFKNINPFEILPFYDIRGYVHNKIAFSPVFQYFCEENKRFTESGNYSTTAETLFQFISHNCNFEEEHTALADSEIECAILQKCIDLGCEWNTEYKVYNSIPRKIVRPLSIVKNGEILFETECEKIRISKDKEKITIW